MKYLAAMLFLSIFSNSLYAFGERLDYPPYIPNEQLDNKLELELTSTENISTIEKIHSYNLKKNIIYEYSGILKDINSKVYFELHLAQSIDPAQGFVAMKINLNRPKIAKWQYILADIQKTKYLLQMEKFNFTDEMLSELNAYQNYLKDYQNNYFPRRFSLGLSLPIYEYNNGTKVDWTAKPAIFFGCDIDDLVTLQFGSVLEGHLYFAMSLDVSTPVFSVSTYFLSKILHLIDLPISASPSLEFTTEEIY